MSESVTELPPPWHGEPAPGSRHPRGGGGGPTPSYPILTEEIGYPPSPLANTGSTSARGGGTGRGASLGPVVTRALQDVLGWKIKAGDPKGFLGALNQSFQLKTVEGAVVSTWTPRSYAVQTDLSGGITGAQASIYTMSKTLLDRALPLIDGLSVLNPAAITDDITAIKDLASSQLTNLAAEVGYMGGPRVMRVHQYFQMLLGVTMTLDLTGTPIVTPSYQTSPPLACPADSPLFASFSDYAKGGTAGLWPTGWTNPDYVLGSLGDLRDQLGLFNLPPTNTALPVPVYINTVADEQNVTNFRIIVDYVNSLLNAWSNSIQFFAGKTSPFLGTQLVIISRQLGVINETVDEVRFVLDSVFIGPSQRETMQVNFEAINLLKLPQIPGSLPPIYLEDLLLWTQTFVGAEAQDAIRNGGKLGLGEDFISMIYQLCTQAYGLYLFAEAHPTALSTDRVLQSLSKLVWQLWDLYKFAAPVGASYIAAQ